MRILKYPIQITDVQIIRLPLKANIIHIGEEDNGLVSWTEVFHNPSIESLTEERIIRMFGTGHEWYIAEKRIYIGTIKMRKKGLLSY